MKVVKELIFCCFLLSIAMDGNAQTTVQQQKDSLRHALSLTEGEEKLDTYKRLVNLYWVEVADEQKRDTLLAIFRDYDAEAARQHNNKRRAGIKANILSMLGNAQQFDEVIRLAPEMLKELAEMGYAGHLYSAYRILIDAHRRKNENEAAIRVAQELHELARQRQDAGGMGIAIYCMSRIYQAQQRWEGSVIALKECVELLKDSTSYLDLLIDVSYQIGISYIAWEHYDDALKAAEELAGVIIRNEEATKRRQPATWAMLYQLKTDAYRMSKRWNEAEIYLNKMDSIKGGTQPYYLERAHIMMGRGKYEQALELIEKDIAAGSPNGEKQSRALKMLILMHACRADEAFDEYTRIIRLNDERLSAQLNAQIDELYVQYEIDKHVAEKIRNRNYFLFALGGCLLLSIALGVWAHYSRKIMRRNRGLYLQIREQDRLFSELENERIKNRNLRMQVSNNNEELTEQELEDEKFEKLASLMKEKLLFTDSNIKREEIAQKVGLSDRSLHDCLKNSTGMSFTEYVHYLRLSYARELLIKADNKLTIEAIAEESGFNSRNTFHRLFHEKYGLSPLEFKKIANEQD